MEVKNKVFMITGAATGIGAGTTRSLVERGAKHVAVLDINIDQGKALQDELNSKYGADRALFIKCDVTTDLHTAFDEATNKFGYIDVVINNAGIMNDAPHIYEKEIAINMTALITGSLKAYNWMRKDRGGQGGTIINISSIVGLVQTHFLPIYSATKSAVLQFSNCLGKTENYSKSGVRVITVCFGVTDTNLICGRIGCFDEDLEKEVSVAINNFPKQSVECAAQGLIAAFESGESASTWLITTNRPAEEITNNVKKAYETLSQGVN